MGSLQWNSGNGEVSSLNCVYLLAPCHENLPFNCILILSANFPGVFFAFALKPLPSPAFDEFMTLSSPLYSSLFYFFSSSICFPLMAPLLSCLCTEIYTCKPSVNSTHVHTYILYIALVFGDTAIAVKATKKLQ